MLFEKEYFLYITNSEGEEELLKVMRESEMCIVTEEISRYKSFETDFGYCEFIVEKVMDYDLCYKIIKAARSTSCWIEEKTIWRK